MSNLANNQTLSELGKRMLVRLGFASQGQGATYKLREMYEYLRSAQSQILMELDSHLLKTVYLDGITNAGQVLYDFESGVDVNKVFRVEETYKT